MQLAAMLQKVLTDGDNCSTKERLNQGYVGGMTEFCLGSRHSRTYLGHIVAEY